MPLCGILLLASCSVFRGAPGGHGGEREDPARFPVTSIPPKPKEQPRPFREFQSATGWSFHALQPAWLEAPNVRTERGVPARTLVRGEDRRQRVTFYETFLPPGHSPPARLNSALAYLFKAEPHESPADSAITLFRPARDTARNWGMLVRSDSALLYVHVESKDPLEADAFGVLRDIRMDHGPDRETGRPGAPDSSGRTFLAAIENTLGLKAVEDSTFQNALKRFQTALELDPANASYLVNCAAIFQLRKENLQGAEFLARYPELLARSAELSGIRGAMLEELGRYSEAKVWSIKALELDPGNTEWLINLSDALWGLGERVHSKNVLLRRHAEQPDFRLSVYLASTHLGLEEYENARQVLEEAHLSAPPTPKSAEYYLRALTGLKEFEGALDFARGLGEDFPHTSNTHLFQGLCEFNLKLYRLAAASAKAALEADPTLREAQQLATQISALMGGRSNLILRTPISPLKTKVTLAGAKAMLASGTLRAVGAQHPMTLLAQDIVFSFTPGKRWKKTRHAVFHIRDPRKLIRLSELAIELNPGYSRFYVNRFRHYDGDLKEVEEQKAGDFYVTKSHNTTLHPENLLVHLPIKARPGVQFLEVIATEESQVALQEFPYLRYDHAYPYPVLRTDYEIIRPPRTLLVSAFGEARVDSLPDRLVVRMDEPALPSDDKFAPSHDEFGTGFSATPFATWREVGMQFENMLGRSGIRLDTIPLPIRERAQEIVDRAPRQSAVRALFRWVRDSVRYNNYEFSLHALIPDRAEGVLTNGYSDCKGHALLLAQLLRARGLESHLSLVSLNHAGDIDQPTIHQFNHMIVHVPAQKGIPQYFLDPTEKAYAFRRAPLALEGKNTLIVDGDNSRMATIPEIDSAAEHRVQMFHSLRVEANQTAVGSDSLVLAGKVAAEFRAHMRAWNPSTKYENLLAWLTQSYMAFTDDRFRILDEDDPDLPLTMVFKYRRKFPFRADLSEFEHYPKLELSFLRFPKASPRRAPVYFPHEIQINSQWNYAIPDGYGWKSLTLDRELSEHYLHWLFSINQGSPESIVIRQNWRIDPFVATPEEYAKIQADWGPILTGSGLKLVISKR